MCIIWKVVQLYLTVDISDRNCNCSIGGVTAVHGSDAQYELVLQFPIQGRRHQDLRDTSVHEQHTLHYIALYFTLRTRYTTYCTIQHGTALYCTVLPVMHGTAWHCTVLPCTARYCTGLHGTALHFTVLPGIA